jgi:hypothetical protein
VDPGEGGTRGRAASYDRPVSDTGRDAGTDAVLNRFLTDVRAAVPLTAMWVHGSLALGDYRPGRSDLDLIALVPAEIGRDGRDRLRRLHNALHKDLPAADKLHCTYVAEPALAEVGRRHVTWAHNKLFERPISPVGRRELLMGDLALYGPGPAGLLPAVPAADLADFIRTDLRDFWYPATGKRPRWLRDIWVDLGLLTLARASVTLRDGTLITKGEALDVLPHLGAPQRVIDDIRRRRYDPDPPPVTPQWRLTRARLARPFVREAITRVLSRDA